MLVKPGDTITLFAQSELGSTDVFPQSVIKDSSGTTLATVNLSHSSSGLYLNTTTAPSGEGYYVVRTIIYTDSARTVQSGVDPIKSFSLEVRHRSSGGGASFGAAVPDIKVLIEPLIKRLVAIEAKVDKKSEFNPSKDKVEIKQEFPK